MKRILSRDVSAYGVLYPVGTDVTKLPKDCQQSVIDSQWTIEVSEQLEASGDSQSDPAGESSNAGASTSQPSDEQTAEQTQNSNEPTPEQTSEQKPEQKVEQAPGDTRPLSALGIAADKLELLAANDPPITTVQQAIDFLAINKTFRTVTGIVKATDADLRSKLGL